MPIQISLSKKTKTLNERIKYEVFAEEELHPIELLLESTEKQNIINVFHGTFLSNFYACPVVYEGVTYPSVEHAYQRAKFDLQEISQLTAEQRSKIDEYLKNKGYARHIEDISTIFSDTSVTSGMTKSIAEILKGLGFQDRNWDERRVNVMVGLLIQKFNNPELSKQLLETNAKLLIEGNSWNDTFWGVTDGKGRNMLGRILMNIRSKLQKGELQSRTTTV